MALTLNNDLKTLKVGDYFWCKYTATVANTVGVFSDLATKTDAEATPVIPVASSNLPNGYFKYIMVEDWNGKKRLIADRNIQHSISWDVLNTAGIASGSGLPVLLDGYDSDKWSFSTRLMTGGTIATDKDDEWDRHIVGSTLDGAITAGDNTVWNWSGTNSWASTTITTTNVNRVARGNVVSGWTSQVSSSVNAGSSRFRPVLEIEAPTPPLNKSFILLSDGYKKLSEGGQETQATYKGDTIPIMTSNTLPSGVATASSTLDSANDSWMVFDKNIGTKWLTSIGAKTGWLSYKFSSPKIIGKYRINNSNTSRSPKSWTFEGSNSGTTWHVLDIRVYSDWVNGVWVDFQFNNSMEYLYYRINVTENNGDANYLAIYELEMHEVLIPFVPATPPSFKTVSPTLPTLPEFQSEGMDDLSIFDRKVQQVLGSPQVMTSSVLGGGKVFKGTVDLKKIFDLRKLEIK